VTSAVGTLCAVLDRVIDRLPALLLFLALALCAHVALFDTHDKSLLVAIIPGFVLLVLYLRAGTGGGGGKGGKKKAAAKGDE
jgi:hypothetical protein